MTIDKKAQYLRIGLALQHIGVTDETAERIIVTYEAVLEKGGDFSITDAVDIELALDRKHKEKSIQVQNT